MVSLFSVPQKVHLLEAFTAILSSDCIEDITSPEPILQFLDVLLQQGAHTSSDPSGALRGVFGQLRTRVAQVRAKLEANGPGMQQLGGKAKPQPAAAQPAAPM